MSRLIALVTLAFVTSLAHAQATVRASVGGITLTLPAPADFVDPTSAAPALKRNPKPSRRLP